MDFIQTQVKKSLAFHEDGSKNNVVTASHDYRDLKNPFSLNETEIIQLGGIIEWLGDDMTMAEEERNTKQTTKKIELEEENRGKAIQQIALETRIGRQNREQVLQHISKNISLTGTSSSSHHQRPPISRKKQYLHRTLDG